MSSHLTTKLSTRITSRKEPWQLSATTEVTVEVDEEAEVVVEVEGLVEVKVGVSPIVVEIEEAVRVKEVGKIKVKIQAKVKMVVKVKGITVIPDTRRPGTPTCPRSSPASATGNSGSRLIFVWNQSPVHGRIIIFQNQTIDSLTSSTKRLTRNYYILLYIKIKFKKYTRVS